MKEREVSLKQLHVCRYFTCVFCLLLYFFNLFFFISMGKTCMTVICHLMKMISSDVFLRKTKIQIMALKVLIISYNFSFLSTENFDKISPPKSTID